MFNRRLKRKIWWYLKANGPTAAEEVRRNLRIRLAYRYYKALSQMRDDDALDVFQGKLKRKV